MEKSNELILTILLNALWMVPLISASAALCALFLRNSAAHQRYVVWIGSLILCVVAPVLTSIQLPFPRQNVQVENSANLTAKDDGESPLARVRKRDWQVVETSSATVRPFAALYAVFILLAVLRFARLWLRKEQLLRSSSVLATSQFDEIVNCCSREFRVGDIKVARSSSATVPYTLGFWKPLIVLPDRFCREVDNETLLSVVAHEVAHVSRRDYLIKLLVEIVSLPISFHPITLLIKRQIERERELACDELVTTHFLTPDTYARSLLSAADLSLLPAPEAVALSIFDGRILEKRIMRLKRRQPRMNRYTARLITSASLVGLCMSAVSLSALGVELRGEVITPLLPMQFSSNHATSTTLKSFKPIQQQAERKSTTPPDSNPRAQAACAAAQKHDVEAIPTLIAMLGDDTKSELVKCWEGSNWSPAIDTFKSSSPGEQAALALASLGRPALQPLAGQLTSSNAVVRRNAAWAIGELTNMLPGERSSAVPQLITLLNDRDVWVRMAAARAIGEVRDRRATPTLLATLSDADWRMRQMTAWALSELKDDKAVNALCATLLSDAKVEVRRGAAEALGEIASQDALATLKQALNDPDPGVFAKVKWAIEEIEG